MTELVHGAFLERWLCQECARPLDPRKEEPLRCAACGTAIDEAKLRRLFSSVTLGKDGLTKAVWDQLQELSACPICGKRLGLPFLPVEILQDPTFQIERASVARLRARLGGPGSVS